MNSLYCLLVVTGELLILFFQSGSSSGRSFRIAWLFGAAAGAALFLLHWIQPWMIPALYGGVLAVYQIHAPQKSCLQNLLSSFLEVMTVSLLLLDAPEITGTQTCLFPGIIFIAAQAVSRKMIHISSVQRILYPVRSRRTGIILTLLLQGLLVLMLWKPSLTPGFMPGILLMVIWLYAVSFQTEQRNLENRQKELKMIHSFLRQQTDALYERQKDTDERLHMIKNNLLNVQEHLEDGKSREAIRQSLLQIQESFYPVYTDNSFLDLLIQEQMRKARRMGHCPVVRVECPGRLNFDSEQILFLYFTAQLVFSLPETAEVDWKVTESWMSVQAECKTGKNLAEETDGSVWKNPELQQLCENLQNTAEMTGGFFRLSRTELRMMVFRSQEERE